jgi:hypothetical protein
MQLIQMVIFLGRRIRHAISRSNYAKTDTHRGEETHAGSHSEVGSSVKKMTGTEAVTVLIKASFDHSSKNSKAST